MLLVCGFNTLTADDEYIGSFDRARVCRRYNAFHRQNYENAEVLVRGQNLLQNGINFTVKSIVSNHITKLEFTLVKNRLFKKRFGSYATSNRSLLV